MAKNFVASFPVMRPSPSENQSIEYHVKESKKGENYQQKKKSKLEKGYLNQRD